MRENLTKKLRKKAKGFTLVEVIVVLVIIAILAALLVPSLTGYIDKARKQAVVIETRQVLMAAQTTATEFYGAGYKAADIDTELNKADTITAIKTLAEVPGTITAASFKSAGGKITEFEYVSGDYTVNYDAAGATVDKKFAITGP